MVTRQEIVPPLGSGLICTDPGLGAGTLFPQPRVVTETGTALLDEAAGYGWRLMIDGRCEAELPKPPEIGLKSIVIGEGGFEETESVAARWFDAFGCRAAIVRPDHYVYCGFVDHRSAKGEWDRIDANVAGGMR